MEITEFLSKIKKYSMEVYFLKFGKIEEQLKKIENKIQKESLDDKNYILEKIMEETIKSAPWIRVHMLSFCMFVSGQEEYALKLLDYILNASYDEIGEYNKLSHFWQICTVRFLNPKLQTSNINKRIDLLYVELLRVFKNAFGIGERAYIPWNERTPELIYFFSSQVLGMEHAPTKTLLDRCYVLKKQLKKDVVIINTAMQIPAKGQAPFYRLVNATYADELSGINKLEFKGETFGFYQCDNRMPDLDIMADIIQRVKSKKPALIICIGGSDICADLCGMFIPQVTISTVFSQIAISCSEYQIVDKELAEADKEELAILNVEPKNVKKTIFTFSFKEQTHRYNREQLKLEDDKFILLVVGWRLDQEITDEFLNMMEKVLNENANVQVAFMGKFDTYGDKLNKFTKLEKNSINLGKQMDALAVIECCDLYINPKRSGGGSSAAEALSKGIPIVTLGVGDVSVVAGKEFWVKDYTIMRDQILKYISNHKFYCDKSEMAIIRSKELLNSEGNFGVTIEEILKEQSKDKIQILKGSKSVLERK